MEQKTNPLSLRAKLLNVGKQFTTFAVSEDSAKKKPGTKDSSYRFTPGYEIVEKIRAKLDEAGIKLEPNCRSESHEMVSMPVHKLINGIPYSFNVVQMYVTVNVEYTFHDTVTGETVGPFTQFAAGANGIDKSISSALSLAERYFLLKYFQITTREPDSEPDLHDCEEIPGLGSQQPVTVRDADAMNARPVRDAFPAQPAAATHLQPQQFPLPQDKANETYARAVESLMYFEQGTESHSRTLNHWMTQLRLAGFETSSPEFAQTLVLTAQSRRMGATR